MYVEEYKANYRIFLDFPRIDMGGSIIRGVFENMLETESEIYYLNSKDELVKKFLPEAYVESNDQALNKMYSYQERRMFKVGILMCIATKDKQIPFGYILCNSPLAGYPGTTKRIDDWTIDFWLSEKARGKGVMTASVYNILSYLKKMEVPRVYAYVDKSNERSIKLLQKCNMVLINETPNMYKFGIRLKSREIPL